MEQSAYVCLAGHKVHYTPHNCIIETYQKHNLAIYFIDPISQDYMSDPVVVNGNVFDRKNIQKWLSVSNIDPLSGELLENKDLVLFPFNMLKYILYSIEDKGDFFAYYSTPTSLRYCQDIADYLPIGKYKRNPKFFLGDYPRSFACNDMGMCSYDGMHLGAWQHMRNPELSFPIKHIESMHEVCLRYLSRHGVIYDKLKLNSCSDNLAYLSLEKLLFVDIFTSSARKGDDIFLSKTGHMIPSSVFDSKIMHEDNNNSKKIEYINCVIDCDTPLPGFLGNARPIVDFVGTQSVKKISIKRWLSNLYTDLSPIPNNLQINNTCFDSYDLNEAFGCITAGKSNNTIQIRSSVEIIYKKMVEIQRDLTKENKKAIHKLSTMVTNDAIKKKNSGKSFGCELMNFRNDLGIPSLIAHTFWGKDFSFLDLSDKMFSLNGCIKDYFFVGCTLQRTIFHQCKFYSCCFVGADMSGCTFIECEFVCAKQFYQTIADPKMKFVSTKIDIDIPKNNPIIQFC